MAGIRIDPAEAGDEPLVFRDAFVTIVDRPQMQRKPRNPKRKEGRRLASLFLAKLCPGPAL